MEMEVICISSDDESDSQKENKTDTFLTNSTEANGVLAHEKTEKTEILFNKNVEEKNLKRKLSHEEKKEITCNNLEKRQKLNVNEDTKEICKSDQCSDVSEMRVKCNYNIQSNKDQEATEKTQLIVKEKKRISYISEDVFPSFISLCLQKCPKHDKNEMNIIVDKLKRRYENLDPIYARSDNFVRFLNEKREAIVNDNKKIYVHIEEVMNEMKKKIKKKIKLLQVNEIYDAIPSTSYATNNVTVSNTVKSDNNDNDDNNEDDEETVSRGTREKIRQISRAMKKCEAVIRKLEEEEVDFDEENDSNYIKVERYKRRMVELYNKLCELTGENADAGRPYLRPKHLNVTQIVAVDQAITNFINSKITRRNEMKMAGALTDNLIFPDYRDILECVDRCNNKKNLGLDEKRRKQMAEKAFKELGEHLQRTRRNDYWDTFSLYLENTEDPAIKDENLAKKLAENRTEGEKRLAAVFQKYVIKQCEMKDQDNEETTSEKEEDEGEDDASIIDDENKNETNSSSVITSESSDNEESISKTVKENLPMEKSKFNINTVNVCHSMDKAISNKTIADILYEKCKKTVKIIIDKENKATVSKNENKTIGENVVDKLCSSNTVLRKDVVKDVDIKTQENSLPAASTINCTKDLTEAKTKDVSKVITDSATKKVARDMTDIMTMVPTDNKNVAQLVTEDTAGLITGDTAQPITEDTAKSITGDITETLMENAVDVIMENVIDGAIENMPNDEQPGEKKKPVLRVRSFAKPPTTWEDNQHKTDKIAQENAPKVTNQIKEVVDLTKEGMAKPSVATKCVIQLGNKIIPVVKRRTVVIPANKNIISVKNITNNYLKVNPQTGKIIAPVRNIPGPTVIRLRANETTSRQGQVQNANTIRNEVIFKNKELIQIIPKESVKIIPKKSAVQSVSKQTDASSSLAKSK